MQISAGELGRMLNGIVEGDAGVLLSDVAKIEEGKPGALSFLANSKYEEYIYTTRSSAVLVNTSFEPAKPVAATLIRVPDAYAAFTVILERFGSRVVTLEGIEGNAYVDPTASVGEHAYIGFGSYISKDARVGKRSKIYPQVFIGEGASIGENCILYPGVKIYHGCEIGNNCILHAGTVIGSDGFGFAPLPDRSYKKIPQTGNVIVEDDVEIGANCGIDRATMGSTMIRKGAKIDNLVQIAHNVEIGEHTVLAGLVGIAGSTRIGRFCVFGGQSGSSGHLVIADGSQFGGQSGLMSSIQEPGKKWFGSPVTELREQLKSLSVQRRLPELLARLEALEKEVKVLKGG